MFRKITLILLASVLVLGGESGEATIPGWSGGTLGPQFPPPDRDRSSAQHDQEDRDTERGNAARMRATRGQDHSGGEGGSRGHSEGGLGQRVEEGHHPRCAQAE